jgi:hypothetical protein
VAEEVPVPAYGAMQDGDGIADLDGVIVEHV